jgi:nicotinate-nucleotide pyrophosphorylase (carboxylating)
MDWNSKYISEMVQRALEEDVGPGDVTAEATIPVHATGRARILAREDLVCAGLPIAECVFRALDPEMRFDERVQDGEPVSRGADLLQISGRARAILTAERTALNFLARLSGIATLTYQFTQQIAGTRAKVLDTRKTTPGSRLLEKYAVRMGGGANHRMGLYDAILLKENHIALAGGIKQALDRAHAYAALRCSPMAVTAYEAEGTKENQQTASISVQIEIRNENDLREALKAGAQAVLLDNMPPAQSKRCVEIARSLRADCVVEISGGITLENVRAYAETGADFLSSGMLTHSAPAANLSLLVDSIEDQ